jgi:hypothetical protein
VSDSANLLNPWLKRTEAATFCGGMGLTAFYTKVRDGVLPRGYRLGKELLWSRDELQAAMEALPRQGDETTPDVARMRNNLAKARAARRNSRGAGA